MNVKRMAIKVNLQIISKETDIPGIADFERWIAATAIEQQFSGEITIRIVDEDEITELNRNYRGKNQPTNVLSFPHEKIPEISIVILGDIIICAPIVKQEAIAQNKALTAHWAHLTIHGLLHLLGYSHLNPKDAQEMEQLEIKILTSLGFDNPYL